MGEAKRKARAVTLVGLDADGEHHVVDDDVIGLTVAPLGRPQRYLRTRVHDGAGRILFVHETIVRPDALDGRWGV